MSSWENPNSHNTFKTLTIDGDVLVLSNSKEEKRIAFSEAREISSDRGTGLAFIKTEEKLHTFTFADENQRDDCFAALSERGFDVSEARQTPMKAASCAGCGALVVGLFTWLFYMAAQDLAEKGEAEIRGRHRLFKRIVAWLIDVIGPTGVMITGGILIALLLYSAVKSASNPPIEIKLTPATD